MSDIERKTSWPPNTLGVFFFFLVDRDCCHSPLTSSPPHLVDAAVLWLNACRAEFKEIRDTFKDGDVPEEAPTWRAVYMVSAQFLFSISCGDLDSLGCVMLKRFSSFPSSTQKRKKELDRKLAETQKKVR